MPGFFNVLVIAAVVAITVVRQFSDRRTGDEKRWWVLPGILLLVAAREDGGLDPHHEALPAVILGAGLLLGLVTGAGRHRTARLWRGPDDSVWSRGTRVTVFVWAGGLALGASLAGAAVLLGIHQGSGALLMSLAVMLLARSGVPAALRARGLRGQCVVPAAVTGGGLSLPAGTAWKDRT
ncbi:DUF1453 domain-containing protein [Streptomyces sp. NBC_01102]|uniref:DUF1453 domain-containing protein n=1 Tax=Streptomyces sp. NBC_01102 TaxID=2903749 RepID=UPI003866FA4B|nr:DUF1453 domain-containing protein [Streptomyces sp. NBC_01102]